jgi:hypothetical protein
VVEVMLNSRFYLTAIAILLSGVLLGVSFQMPEAEAVVKAKAAKSVVKKPTIPVGMVSAEEALKRIDVHYKAIEDRDLIVAKKYNYEGAFQTLHDMFVRKNVHETAMGYVDSWGGNGVYLTWLNGLSQFYAFHKYQLADSARPMRILGQKYMKASDLEYLDNGMAAWIEKEKTVAPLMEDYVYHLAKKAYFLGEAMKYTHDKRFYSIHTPEFAQKYGSQVSAATEMAAVAGSMAEESQNRVYAAGKLELFSVVTAENRIAVEPPKETCQDIFVQNKNFPSQVNYTGESSQASANPRQNCQEVFVQNKNVPAAIKY